MLLSLGAGAALLLCFLSGAKKRVAAIVLINSLIGAAVAFIPMFFGHFLPAWAFPLCGALGAAGAFFYFY